MVPSRARLWQAAALLALALGAALRLWFIVHTRVLTGDTLLYGDIALSWMQHGVYGFLQGDGDPLPTLIRLPGYPLFLMLSFRLFGPEHYTAVLNLQCLLDLLACLLLAALVRRLFGTRPALLALFLAALCPFTASYVAVPLTETLTCATIVLAFYALQRWRPQQRRRPQPPNSAPISRSAHPRSHWSPWNRWLWLLSATLAYSILLRPDQALLAVAILPAMLWLASFPSVSLDCHPERSAAKSKDLRLAAFPASAPLKFKQLLPPLAALLCLLLPFVPWTIRNARTFHVFQPLAPRSAADPGEPVPTGFYRWYRSWAVDFSSTEDIYWKYDGATIQPADLPRRAFDSPAQLAETVAILDAYNLAAEPTPTLDARFNQLAEDRIHAHPLRYYLALPLARLANMLLRPRIELFPIPLAWWRWHEHPRQTAFALAYAALNLAYLVCGTLGLRRWLRRPNDPTKPIAWSMLAFVALRCALLLTLDNSEPRYTMEFFPILIIGIAYLLGHPETYPTTKLSS